MLKKYNGSSWVSTPTWKKMSSGLTTGLVSYYKMDETSGTTCTDSVGSNNGTIVGATINQTGKIDKCYSYDGSNDYVSIDDDIITSTWSVSMWIKRDDTSSGFLYTRDTDDVDIYFSTNDLKVYSTAGASQVIKAITDTNWHHIVITYNGTTLIGYVNDIEEYNGAQSITSWASTDSVKIGSTIAGASFFTGDIDEVGIWNRALTSKEVSELYNTNKARKLETFDYDYADVKKYEDSNWDIISPIQYDQDLSNGLISYYNFEETSGTTCNDQVGSNDGTIVGCTINQIGKIDKCYDFDGSNDYIITTEKLTSVAQSHSFWVKFDTLSTWSPLIGASGTGGTGPNGFSVLVDAAGDISVFSNAAGSKVTTELTTGIWYHIVVTWDGTTTSSNFKIYINAGTPYTPSVTAWSGDSTDYYTIGAYTQAGTQYGFTDGKIDEVGIWNRLLSSTEVSKLYNNSKARHYE